MLEDLIAEVDASKKLPCPNCGFMHHYDFCPECGHPSTYFEANETNQREHGQWSN